jgi:CHASE3 domain sensor protein
MNRGARIVAGFAVVVFVLGIAGIAAYINAQQLIDRNNWVIHTHEVVENLSDILSALKDAETGQRGFILTGEDRYLEPYDQAAGLIQSRLTRLNDLTRKDPDQQAAIVRLKTLIDAKMAELRQTVDLRRSSGIDAAMPVILSDRGKKIMDDIRVLIGRMRAREQQLLRSRERQSQTAARRTILAIAGGLPISLLILALAAIILMRSGFSNEAHIQTAIGGARWIGILVRYLFAAVAVAFAIALRHWLLTFGPMPLFITFYPAVLLVATVAGGGPGILTTVLSALAADYWFISPTGGFSILAESDVLAVALFMATNLVLCVVAEHLRRSRWAEAYGLAKQQEAEQLARKNEELTQQSEELAQQSEELAQQNEELQSQSEKIQSLNAELSGRESMLQKLLDATRLISSEEAVLKDICAAATELFGPAASAIAEHARGPKQ